MHFDYTISLGSLITLAGVFAGFWAIAGRLAVLEFKINELWEDRDRQ